MASITSGARISCSSACSGASAARLQLAVGARRPADHRDAARHAATSRHKYMLEAFIEWTTSPRWLRISRRERDDALVAFAGAALVGHRRDDLERVAVLDRLVDPPGVDAQHGDDGAVVDARLAHQPAGDRQHERPVRDRLAVGLLLAELPVDVRRVEVARQAGEVDDVRLRHRAARRAIGLADLEVLEVEAAWLSLLHGSLPSRHSPMQRAMTLRWISLVPPPIMPTRASRNIICMS